MTIDEKIKEIIEERKKTAFVKGYEASDAEALGLIIASYFHYDGRAILEVTYSALEDSNFHSENETIQELIESLK